MDSRERWHVELLSWAIPEAIRAAGPATDPWSLQVSSFVDHAMSVDSTGLAHVRAREALRDGGSVLDVGCGAGAATVGAGPAVTQTTGVDERADMLDAFRTVMADRNTPGDTLVGRWPDVAHDAPVADVVLSHHVLWNVPDPGPFLQALGDHARRRVVLEVPERHPRSWTSPYWKAVHGLERPTGPTGDDLVAIARDMGLDPHVEVEERPSNRIEDRERRLDHLMSHLCLHEADRERLAAIDDVMPEPAPRHMLTLWWNTDG